MNTWLHRISHHEETSYPLLSKGYLSIGFSDFSNSNFINQASKNGREYFENEFVNRWGYKPRNRHNLWRFLFEMKKGDRVVVPSRGTFYICEIEDDVPLPIGDIDTSNLKTRNNEPINKKNNLLYCGEKLIELGFVRKVKLIKSKISRQEYADAQLTARMKIRSMNANISDISISIDNALKSFNEKSPINIHSGIIKNSQQQWLDIITKDLNPDKFELLIKWYFERVGATKVTIPSKNERNKQGDADVIATFEPIKTIIYVQVKFHNGETGDWASKQIFDYVTQKGEGDNGYAHICWVVSSAESFSEQCITNAENNNIILLNGNDIVTMILDAGIANLDL